MEEHKQELAEKTLEEGDSSKLQEHEYEIEQADHQVLIYTAFCLNLVGALFWHVSCVVGALCS